MRFRTTRRDFLRMVGSSVGCMLLSSCGGSGNGTSGLPPAPLPNGYVFTRIYSPGEAVLPDVAALTPQILMDEAGHVFFYAQDSQGRFGMYELTVDYDAARPRAAAARPLLATGQAMPDGRIVSTIGAVDVNRRGEAAMVLNFDAQLSPQGSGPTSIVLAHDGQLDTVLDFGDEAPGSLGAFGEFGDLDLHDDRLLFVSRYGGDGETNQGLVYATSEGLDGLLVVSADDEIPGADGSINSLGLVDLDDGGNFVLQAFGADAMVLPRGQSSPASFVLRSNVDRPLAQARLLTASPELVLSRSARTDNPPLLGTSLHGPRIGGQGITTAITEEGVGNLTLYRDDAIIAQTGQLSPGGSPIRIIVPAVVNASGLTFYEVATDQGIELCLHNGDSSVVLLSRGSLLDGLAVDTIAFGFHTTMVDAAGRLVSYVQMADGQESILLGIPV